VISRGDYSGGEIPKLDVLTGDEDNERPSETDEDNDKIFESSHGKQEHVLASITRAAMLYEYSPPRRRATGEDSDDTERMDVSGKSAFTHYRTGVST
jgi:hypothetical protein